MKTNATLLFITAFAACSLGLCHESGAKKLPTTGEQVMEWKVSDQARKALVFVPKPAEKPAPVVMVFHGHGGTMQAMAKKTRFPDLWPEAIVVYPQGLLTPGKFDPEGKKPGWQKDQGDQNDRDLKLVDEILRDLRGKHKIDDARIYATGHSNGGGFTYLLWAARPKVFAAYAPSAAGMRNRQNLSPAPVMHIAGEKDATVPFENQQQTMAAVRKINGCEETGKAWAVGCTLFPSKTGAPFVQMTHAGDHKFPDEAPKRIVQFFKEFGPTQPHNK